MKLYFLMYLFFAESSKDPLIQYLNQLGKEFNKYFPYVNIFLILCLFVFIFGIFLFHSTIVISFASKLTKMVSKKFSKDLEELSLALSKKGNYLGYKWLKEKNEEELTSRKIFEDWMQNVFTQEYFNNVTAFAYFGASILIFIIGLRGIRIFITSETPMLVIFGIMLEFSMLILLAFTQFYTPETLESEKEEKGPVIENLVKEVNKLKGTLGIIEKELEDAKKLVRDAQDSLDNNTDQEFWRVKR